MGAPWAWPAGWPPLVEAWVMRPASRGVPKPLEVLAHPSLVPEVLKIPAR